jgi:hypothetical protein
VSVSTIIGGTKIVITTIDDFKFTYTTIFFITRIISAIIIIITNYRYIVAETFTTVIISAVVIISTVDTGRYTIVSFDITVVNSASIIIITFNRSIGTSIFFITRNGVTGEMLANNSGMLTTSSSTA